MRRKKPGALFMDFEISPEDRIGGAQRGRKAKAKPAGRPRKPKKGERVEPGSGGGFFTAADTYDDDEPPRLPPRLRPSVASLAGDVRLLTDARACGLRHHARWTCPTAGRDVDSMTC